MSIFERDSRVTKETHFLEWGGSYGMNHVVVTIDHTHGFHLSEKFHDDFVEFLHDWARENFEEEESHYGPNHRITYACQDEETIPVLMTEEDENPPLEEDEDPPAEEE